MLHILWKVAHLDRDTLTGYQSRGHSCGIVCGWNCSWKRYKEERYRCSHIKNVVAVEISADSVKENMLDIKMAMCLFNWWYENRSNLLDKKALKKGILTLENSRIKSMYCIMHDFTDLFFSRVRNIEGLLHISLHWLPKKKQVLYKDNIVQNLNATVEKESYMNSFLLQVNTYINWNTYLKSAN